MYSTVGGAGELSQDDDFKITSTKKQLKRLRTAADSCTLILMRLDTVQQFTIVKQIEQVEKLIESVAWKLHNSVIVPVYNGNTF